MIGSGINIEPIGAAASLDNEGSAIMSVCLTGIIQKVVTMQGVIQKC